MSLGYQIPRSGMVWLLSAMFAAILPHVDRLPVWVTLVCLLCGLWRLMVYRGRWPLPGRLIKALLVFSGGAAVWGHYGTLMGPAAGSALLILGFCFKLLETHQRRDVFIVVVLGYFVVATSFFFVQHMLASLYLLLVCFLVTTALVGLNQSPLGSAPGRTARLGLRLMLHAAPLTLVLFLLVPRVGPLWALNLDSGQARTGLSETLNPGDIARLTRSSELAFRAEFEGAVPPPRALYWRALVMDHFDGRRWQPSRATRTEDWVARGDRPLPWRGQMESLGQRVAYRVIMEPSDQRWLYGLNLARPQDQGIGVSRDFRLVNAAPVSQTYDYQVVSWLDYRLDAQLPGWLAQHNRQLPEKGNPRARALAARLRQATASDAELVEAMLRRFSEEPYVYSLTPPPLGQNAVDAFLFDSLEGFCSHYASALAFMLRSAGVPARVVAGYQGGEANPLGGYLLVHQYDAHAWVEAWLPGQGWVRLDPTARVAPERVEAGSSESFAGQAGFLADNLLSPARYRDWAWVNRLRLGWDYLNYAWYRTVVGYDAQSQRDWLGRFFRQVDWQLMGALLGGALALSLALIWVLVVWGRRGPRRAPEVLEYERICRLLARQGWPPRPGESPVAHLRRLAAAAPETEDWQAAAEALEASLYQPQSARPEAASARNVLRRLRQRLVFNSARLIPARKAPPGASP